MSDKRIVEGEPVGTSANPVGWPPVFRDPAKRRGDDGRLAKRRPWFRRRQFSDLVVRAKSGSARANLLLVAGVALAGFGLGTGVDSIVDFARGQDWTVSLGGLLLGVGVGVALLSRIIASEQRGGRLASTLVVVGSSFAGYSAGGALDELLRRIDGEGGGLAVGMGFAGVGLAVAILGWIASRKNA